MDFLSMWDMTCGCFEGFFNLYARTAPDTAISLYVHVLYGLAMRADEAAQMQFMPKWLADNARPGKSLLNQRDAA